MFPLNTWYIAGWGHEISRKLLSRKICGKQVLLYRKLDGSVAALEDACWHRLLPLSLGTLHGDSVQCAYHGLEFDPSGRCTKMPSQETLNPSACVKAFPVVERHRFIWIWMGQLELADPDQIPDLTPNEHPEWAGDGGYIYLEADYRLLIDNLMDLTHETFVHPTSIGNKAVAESPFTVSRTHDHVTVARWMIDIEAPPFFQKQLGSTEPVDRWQFVNFLAPSTVTIDVGVALTGTGAPEGNREKGVTGFVFHSGTPESERSTHYYWAFLRSYKLDSRRMTTEAREGVRAILHEDKAIIEAQQHALDANPDRDFYPLNVDGGALLARRRIEEMLDAERGAQAEQRKIVPVHSMPASKPLVRAAGS